MCLIFLSYNQHPKYSFIAVANRDEFFERPAKQLDSWKEHPDIIAGKDLQEGGTWLGVSKTGHFSMLTNYRDMHNIKANAPSRGKLVLDYLISKINPADYLEALFSSASMYNGYNILLGTFNDPWYYSNQNDKIVQLGTGSYGLSNALLDTGWAKVNQGKKAFNRILEDEQLDTEALFSMMQSETLAQDDELPDTGIGYEKEKLLSSMFIKMPGYGTRNTTLILKDREQNVSIEERTFDSEANQKSTANFTFKVTR